MFLTYIIADEIRMVLLDAIIQDSHHDTSSCVALSPGYFGIQVLMYWGRLEKTQAFCSAVNLLLLTLPRQTKQADQKSSVSVRTVSQIICKTARRRVKNENRNA